MTEKLFHCRFCDKTHNIFIIDGYGWGDRLLEGVEFIVENVNGKPKCHGVTDENIPYFEQLNKDYWIKICEEFCEELDIAKCPECGKDDCLVWGEII